MRERGEEEAHQILFSPFTILCTQKKPSILNPFQVLLVKYMHVCLDFNGEERNIVRIKKDINGEEMSRKSRNMNLLCVLHILTLRSYTT